MRNPELARAYGKAPGGGLLLYGPPGVGKTYIARALAGELDARFLSLTIADILATGFGESERNVRSAFDTARAATPCVLFLDEVDALGRRRSDLAYHADMRNVVQQFLTEMDSVGAQNTGLYVLGATNAPWDIDPALRRPGRFDRTVFVPPPDASARAQIFQRALLTRPVAGVDLCALVKATDGYSGADIVYVCTTAAERAMQEAMGKGQVVPVSQQHLEAALGEVRPSVRAWFGQARNTAVFGNDGGEYDDLLAYISGGPKRRGRK